MQTTNGYTYIQKGSIIILFIPATEGIYTPGVQSAQREICANLDLNFSEIKIKKLNKMKPGQTYIDTKGNLLTITDVSGEVIYFHSPTIKTGCFDRSGTYFMINSAFAQTLKLIDQ